MATPAQDPRSLMELASDISLDLGKLATGLAGAGASPPAVQHLHQMAEAIGAIAKTLGAAPHTGSAPAPEAGAGPAAAGPAPGGPPAGAPAPGPATAGPQPSASPSLAHPSFHQGAADLQAALASKHAAAQRALAGNQ